MFGLHTLIRWFIFPYLGYHFPRHRPRLLPPFSQSTFEPILHFHKNVGHILEENILLLSKAKPSSYIKGKVIKSWHNSIFVSKLTLERIIQWLFNDLSVKEISLFIMVLETIEDPIFINIGFPQIVETRDSFLILWSWKWNKDCESQTVCAHPDVIVLLSFISKWVSKQHKACVSYVDVCSCSVVCWGP